MSSGTTSAALLATGCPWASEATVSSEGRSQCVRLLRGPRVDASGLHRVVWEAQTDTHPSLHRSACMNLSCALQPLFDPQRCCYLCLVFGIWLILLFWCLFREHCPKSEFITTFSPKAFFLKKNKDHLLNDDRMKCILIAVSLRAAAVEFGLDLRVFTSSSFWGDSSQIWRTVSWQR